MRTRTKWLLPLHMGLLCLMLGLTSCENGNLFGGLNDRGSGGSIDVLQSDAENALRQKDYQAALALFNQILAADPDNSLALYGAAAAELGGSGLNIGQIIANVLKQRSSSGVNNLGDLIADSREVISVNSNHNSDILFGINKAALRAIINRVVCRLRIIISGAGDGVISKDSIDVILNLAVICAIRAAIMVDWIVITNVNGTYDVTINQTDATAFCNSGLSNTADGDTIRTMIRDIVGAYALFNRAVVLLNLQGNQIIRQLRDDIGVAASKLLDKGANQVLPTVCLDFADNLGITQGTFTSDTNVFLPISTVCP